ncbi:unnamed protein product [Cercospora beticola]|nr:unnamed protein product [Cercospora beticola]
MTCQPPSTHPARVSEMAQKSRRADRTVDLCVLTQQMRGRLDVCGGCLDAENSAVDCKCNREWRTDVGTRGSGEAAAFVANGMRGSSNLALHPLALPSTRCTSWEALRWRLTSLLLSILELGIDLPPCLEGTLLRITAAGSTKCNTDESRSQRNQGLQLNVRVSVQLSSVSCCPIYADRSLRHNRVLFETYGHAFTSQVRESIDNAALDC